jgi:UPF0755 protein
MPKIIRTLFKILSALIAVAIAAAAFTAFVLVRLNAPPETAPHPPTGDSTLRIEDDGSLFIEVRNGETALSVGRRLEEAGVIRRRIFWQILSRVGKDPIKSGSYRIPLPADQMTLHAALVSGEQILVKVTIPEGVTLKKTAALFEQAGVCGADDFLAAASSQALRSYYRVPGETMEGYLYPDTYRFPLKYPADMAVTAMADTFFNRLEAIAPEADALSPEELNDKIIIASIVEREYRVADEAPLMAGVFYNRLRIGMALQSCATVEYLITERLGRPHPEVLYNRDIEIRDPYNTYLRPGLTPGPISAPGRVALDAAFHPAPSDYLYFRLQDADAGRHYFSRTLDDHIKAGALYVKSRGR